MKEKTKLIALNQEQLRIIIGKLNQNAFSRTGKTRKEKLELALYLTKYYDEFLKEGAEND